MKKVFLTLVIVAAMATSSFNAKAANIGPCVLVQFNCQDGSGGTALLCGGTMQMINQAIFWYGDICG